LPASAVAAILIVAALAIGVAGTKLAGIADELTDRTGLGEIIGGALFVVPAPRCPASSRRSRRRRGATLVSPSGTHSAA
jgi:cation:H+ antiporter